MKGVYAISTNITSALGLDTDTTWSNVVAGNIGIKEYKDEALSPVPFYGSKIDETQWEAIRKTVGDNALSPFEQLCVYSASKALQKIEIDLNETVLVLSTTKGNIELLGQASDEQILLHRSAQIISKELGLANKPVIISHACVSGVVACLYAQRLLESGRYKNAIVIGADRFTKFVLSGFQSFQAVADAPCKPFDAHRKGINLGEAAATIILTTDSSQQALAQLLSGST
ncbi:MAG TPA: beta-ketoacyl synthase N-terminal-like domain-containing protein, partial [Flavipsychrobacter sp.]|nr:beta-ketoacyl synthase N-terminal-like domain-containing protein [Flavipsychrobacter sp.]